MLLTRIATAAVAGSAALTMSPAVAPGAASAAPPDGCRATARVVSEWGGATGGQILAVTVTNTSAATTAKWTVSWSLGAGQRVVSQWNAVVTTAGGAVTAGNAPHNGTLAPDASVTFGVQLYATGPVPAPSCDNGATPPGVTVGLADTQSTVTLVPGQTLTVSLPAEFPPPTGGGTVLTRLSATGGYPTGQPMTAIYRATAFGPTTLSTVSDYPCLHTTPPCALPVRLWTVRVNVVGLL